MLELLRLLSRTNCKRCGESTCFNFALELAAGPSLTYATSLPSTTYTDSR